MTTGSPMSQGSPKALLHLETEGVFTMSPPGEPIPLNREALMVQQTSSHPISCQCPVEAKDPGIQLTLQPPLQHSRNS